MSWRLAAALVIGIVACIAACDRVVELSEPPSDGRPSASDGGLDGMDLPSDGATLPSDGLNVPDAA